MADRQCGKCGKVKPLDEFPKHPRYKDGRHPWCRDCTNRGRNPTRARVVRRRARQRATAELIQLHREEFDQLVERHMAYVSDEFDAIRSTAKATRDRDTDVPRLKPGPKRTEQDSVIDRLDVARCPHCVKHHDRGHRCPKCGAQPGVPERRSLIRRVGDGIDPAVLGERGRYARRSS